MNKTTMKEFTTAEIRDLLNRVMREEISFSEMVEVLNYRMNEESRFKDGDFVYEDGRILIFKSYPNNYHCLYYPHIGEPFFDNSYGIDFTAKSFRRVTEDEKQILLDVLAKKGKMWNEEKKCVENMQVRKFKKGDKVRIKHGISSKTHNNISPGFVKDMDDLIGKTMTVYGDPSMAGYVDCNESGYRFHEDWLEPYSDPQYKNGDFVVGLGCILIVHKQIDENSVKYHVLYAKTNGKLWYDKIYWQRRSIDNSKLATEAEKQEFLDTLAKEGKRWNEEKKCIEDIPKRKFKAGDKVKIKDGISSKTHIDIGPSFVSGMDEFIGMNLTVAGYTECGCVFFNEDVMEYDFAEDWLEPYEELKKGDLAIFWDEDKKYATIRIYDRSNESARYIRHKDHKGSVWANAIKFESKEQYEKLLKGED